MLIKSVRLTLPISTSKLSESEATFKQHQIVITAWMKVCTMLYYCRETKNSLNFWISTNPLHTNKYSYRVDN